MAQARILEHLAAVGLSVYVIDDDRIVVSPKALLTDELRTLIREQRGNIVSALRPVGHIHQSPLSEPQPDPANWHQLDMAYHGHHWDCGKCIAAGQGRGLRCGVGMALWRAYVE